MRAVHLVHSFALADLEPYARAGTASVVGQAFRATRGGGVVVAAGREVRLYAGTPFFLEVVEHLDRGYSLAEYELVRGAIRAAARRTVADAEGRFVFAGLPAGEWVVETELVWEVPGYAASYRAGGVLRQRVRTAAGEVASVALTE